MKRLLNAVLLVATLVTAAAVWLPSAMAQGDAEAMAMEAMDEFMTAFNAKDPEAWAASLNYPHVRFAGGGVTVWENAEAFADDAVESFARLRAIGWDHSVWDSREVVQVSEDKVHIVVTFSRFTKDDEKIATFQSLYIVTKQDGHWGTQARSSFAP